jgi:hypothetical protein
LIYPLSVAALHAPGVGELGERIVVVGAVEEEGVVGFALHWFPATQLIIQNWFYFLLEI